MKLVLCHFLLNITLAVIPPLHPMTTQDLKMWWSLIVVGHLRDIEPQHVSSEKSLGHSHSYFRKRIISCNFKHTSNLFTQSTYKKDIDQAVRQVFAYKR